MGQPELRVFEQALNWDPAEVRVPSVPAVAAGGDPMSVMIAAFMPSVPVEVTQNVAATRAREERFAANLTGARNAYQSTDGAGQQNLQAAGEAIDPAGAANAAGSAGGAGSPADQMGQLGQLMGMPMQMAAQAAQMPMQMMGMAAAAPQGIMQGVQSAMQQVGQMSQQGGADEKSAGQADLANVENESQQRAEEQPNAAKAEPNDEARSESGAAAGVVSGDRAPEPEQPAPQQDTSTGPPAQTRRADSPEIAL